mmetsp:Transcript_17567/g.52770  ORF Transcript_17567/g.52770 Transcript_17567/m.52770 type:complete len:201 (+) Transcript_17567:934-1536(+)
MEFESKDARRVALRRLTGSEGGVCHEQQVGERSPEVCAVHITLIFGAGVVDVFALGAEDFDGALPGHICNSHRQARLPIAEDPRAPPELARLELFEHGAHAAGGEDEADVDEAVEHLGRALHQLMLLLRQDLRCAAVRVQDQIQCVIIVRHLGGEAAQVEVVGDELVLHLAEELVALQAAEPADPRRNILVARRGIAGVT